MTLRPTAVLAGLLAVTAHAAALDAQTVRGSVWDEATGDAVAVAMVVLEDVAGERVAMALSNDRGLYLVRAPEPGRYRVRVERIGFRSHATEPFELAAGEDRVQRLGVRTEAVRLDGIVVAGGEARCRLPRREGELLSDLWDEARKSLELAVWAEDERGAHVRVRSHERVLDLVTGDVLEERARSRSGMARAPFFARPADELARDGYVVEDESGVGYIYYGLSAETILSDAFQETHCFRVRGPDRGQPADEVGLAFEPAPGRQLPGVAGVLWLDRTTAELKRVEYNFTRHLYPVNLPLEAFGGRTGFRRLANGVVVVESWWIRMPRFQWTVTTDELPTGATLSRTGRETEREIVRQFRRAGLTIREAGAEAAFGVVPGTGAGTGPAGDAAPATAVIHGVVHDSLTGGPLAGAEVFLPDSHHSAITDDVGRFTLDGVPPGDRRMSLQHPSLEALGVETLPWTVSVLAGDTVRFDLATPSAATVLGARCPAGGRWIVGFVRDQEDGSPVAGALVTAEWVEQWRREGDHAFSGERFRHGAITDDAGAYAVCDVQPGMRVRVQVEIEGGRTVRREVEVRAGDGGRADFLVDPRARAGP